MNLFSFLKYLFVLPVFFIFWLKCSRVCVFTSWIIFIIVALKSLSDNFHICIIPALPSVDCIFPCELRFSWLICQIFLDHITDILSIMLGVTGSCWNLVENVDFFRQTIDTAGLGMQVLNWLLWIVAPMSVPLSKSLQSYSHFSWMSTISWSGWDLEGKEPVSSVLCLCSSVCDRIQARLAWRWAQKLDDNIMSLFPKSSFSIQSPWYFPVSWGFPFLAVHAETWGFLFDIFLCSFCDFAYVEGRFIRKDPDAGKDWGQKEKTEAEDEMVGWHHRLNGRESEQTLGDSEGQGSQAYCSPWGLKELDTTEQLNNSNTRPNGWGTQRGKSMFLEPGEEESPSPAFSMLVRGGDGEHVTSRWPMSWIWGRRVSSPPSPLVNVHSAHDSRSGSCSQNSALGGGVVEAIQMVYVTGPS